ncbi:MAG: glycosyltransferase family 9 protein [Candidatus Zixiibacteriota bacterium]|jgi:ADP-heptose:LPS heptosyltransferase
MADISTPAFRIERFTNKFRRRRAAEAVAWAPARVLFPLVRPLGRKRGARADRVLVVQRILRIGDTLVARPALAALREKHPEAEIGVVCQPALVPVCRADPLIDRVIESPPGRAAFFRAAREARAFGAATAYVFVPDRWSSYLAWLAGARTVIGYNYPVPGAALTDKRKPPARANVPAFLYPPDAPAVSAAEIWTRLVDPAAPRPTCYPSFDPGDDCRAAAQSFVENAGLAGKRPLVVMHPGAANDSYLWREDRWLDVGRNLLEAGAGAIIVTGGPTAWDRTSAVALAEGLGAGRAAAATGAPLLQTFALVAAADLVVTVDTAPVHIASTMGTPVVALYGPGDETMWSPVGVPFRVVAGESPCRGCKAAACFQDRHYCMDSITADAAAEAATSLLAEISR